MSAKSDLSSVKLILHPITLLPVDSGAYDIRFDIVDGGRRLGAAAQEFLVKNNVGVHLCIGSEFDHLDLGQNGWDPAQHLFPPSPSGTGTVSAKPTLFDIVWKKNLWAQSVPCWAYLHGWTGNTLKHSKSNTVTMPMPIFPYKGLLTVDGIGMSQPPPKYLLPPQGRRLVQLRYSRERAFGQLLFLDPQLRLETSEQYRGFDVYTSILALTDITMGVCKVPALNGAALATHLKGVSPSPVPAMGTWQQIISNLPNPEPGWLMLVWNSGQAFLVGQHIAQGFVVLEYGPNGYKQTPVSAWQGSGTYQVRRLIHTWSKGGQSWGASGVATTPWGQSFKDMA